MSALLLPNEILSMSAQAARKLVEAGDGDCALLYLSLLECGDPAKAQAALHWGRARVEAGYDKLVAMGLAQARLTADTAAPAPREELPRYSRQDVMDAMEREPEFTGLYREVERLLNRPLSESALTSLYTMYDALALPPEVILLLVGYLIRTTRRQKGSEKACPRMPQILQEAFRWKRQGLDTAEAAERYLRQQQQVDGREWEILSAVGVTQRRPAVEKEREYISAWVELGISDELIRLAYQRTVYQKGDMNWPYLNKILMSWHKSGWTTVEQVRANDRPAKRPAPPAKGAPPKTDYQPSLERIERSQEWMDRFLEEQKQKGE